MRAGVAIGTISHVENARVGCTRVTLSRLLDALCVDDLTAASAWSLWQQQYGQAQKSHQADRSVLQQEINLLATLRQRAWLRGDSTTARILTSELERLWDVYRRSLAGPVSAKERHNGRAKPGER